MSAVQRPWPVDDTDDRFHAVASPDRYWTETGWWGFWLPEHGLAGTIYTLFRPNLGVVASGVHVWDAATTSNVDAAYSRAWWHLPVPDGSDPTSYRLDSGLTLERIAPFERYRFTYADTGIALDLEVEGHGMPHRLGGIWFDGGERGHYDQPTRVTGTLELAGTSYDVDCFALRDRSWHERPELMTEGTAAGYTYCTVSADEGFHLLTRCEHPTRESAEDQRMYGGFLRRDGVTADLVEGRREVLGRRPNGTVDRLRLTLRDALDRTLVTEGTTSLMYPFFGSSSILAWYGLVEWELPDGRTAVGEDQDCWTPNGTWGVVR